MKIIAVSDTHLKDSLLPSNLVKFIEDCDIVVHAGDFTSMECYRTFEATGKLKAVHGNSDEAELKSILPERLIFEADGVSIGVVHEGALSLNDTTALRYLALEMGVDVLIFGHFHRPLIEQSDVLLICPGSPTNPRMADPTAVELIVENGSVSASIFEVGKSCCDYLEYLRKLDKEKKE